MNDGEDEDASENLSTRSLARPQAFATLLLRGVVFNGVSIRGREEMKRSACLNVSHEYLDCLKKKKHAYLPWCLYAGSFHLANVFLGTDPRTPERCASFSPTERMDVSHRMTVSCQVLPEDTHIPCLRCRLIAYPTLHQHVDKSPDFDDLLRHSES